MLIHNGERVFPGGGPIYELGNRLEGEERTEMKSMKTLIIGLGNPILSDDGVGHFIAQELKSLVGENGINIVEANVSGLGLVELLVGYDRAIIIDAIQTVNGQPGHIHRLDAGVFRSSRKAGPLHDLDFFAALEIGKRIGLVLPQQITVFAVEAVDVSTFSEECTPDVKDAIPICVARVLEELESGADGNCLSAFASSS